MIIRAGPEENLLHGIDVGTWRKYSSPEVVDWDKDGVKDLIAGKKDGTHYYKGRAVHGIIDVGHGLSHGLQ